MTRCNIHVKPKATLGVTACRCERQAAVIRNHTVDALHSGDTSSVAWRFLQNRSGERKSAKCAATYGALAGVGLVGTAVCLGNLGRYRKSRRACEQYLAQRLDATTLAAVRSLPYTAQTRSEVAALVAAAPENLATAPSF
jgi:hypothetical protein